MVLKAKESEDPGKFRCGGDVEIHGKRGECYLVEHYYHVLRNFDFILRVISKRITCPDLGDEQRETRLKNWKPRRMVKEEMQDSRKVQGIKLRRLALKKKQANVHHLTGG